MQFLGQQVTQEFPVGVGECDFGKGDQKTSRDRAEGLADAAHDRGGEHGKQKLQVGKRLEALVEPVERACGRRKRGGDDPGRPHHPVGLDTREQCQVLVVGIGAHRLAGTRALQEPE